MTNYTNIRLQDRAGSESTAETRKVFNRRFELPSTLKPSALAATCSLSHTHKDHVKFNSSKKCWSLAPRTRHPAKGKRSPQTRWTRTGLDALQSDASPDEPDTCQTNRADDERYLAIDWTEHFPNYSPDYYKLKMDEDGALLKKSW